MNICCGMKCDYLGMAADYFEKEKVTIHMEEYLKMILHDVLDDTKGMAVMQSIKPFVQSQLRESHASQCGKERNLCSLGYAIIIFKSRR